jgi:sec-independent protein translocase protein TatA
MLTGILQPTHLIILLAIALIFLGPKRLPDAGRALGQGLREFKASIGGESPDQPPCRRPPPTARHLRSDDPTHPRLTHHGDVGHTDGTDVASIPHGA